MRTPFAALRVAALSFVGVVTVVGIPYSLPAGGSTAIPTTTLSHYEANVDPTTLMSQGQAAGEAGDQGLVILDFGRPAVSGSVAGTMDFDGEFVSLPSIVAATQEYIQAYLASAPPNLELHVAIGTNNSCGTGQPCRGSVCGCQLEPPSYAAWGAEFASAVEQTQSETNVLREQLGDTDVITVVAGDDAEPAFDPGYQNTYDLLHGYADAVAGFQPAMIDFGSADPGYWSNDQLLQVVDGFSPDVAVPEIYNASEADSWASLVSFASTEHRNLFVYGVLTNASSGDNPQVGYSSLLNGIAPITGQAAIPWISTIGQ